MTTVTLKQLQETAKAVRLKAGDRVVFLPMGGIWYGLRGLTGVVKKKNKDPIWRYDVEIDLPHLLYPDANHMQANDFITCVGPDALVALKTVPKSQIPELNRGLGIATILPKMSYLVAHKRLWLEILKMSEKSLRNAQRFFEEKPSSYFEKRKRESSADIKFNKKRISEYDVKIAKLKARGALEPEIPVEVDKS